MPNGSRYWRYNYRFGGKHKTLALGQRDRGFPSHHFR
jgi:hypothetical protein